MKVAVDTNVLIAAFIARGVCHDLLEHLVRHHRVVTSDHILAEFRDVLVGKFDVLPETADSAAELLRSQALYVPDAPLPERVSRDADDDAVLVVAVNGKSTCLITGDDDLLSLGAYQGVEILKPRDFWAFEARR